MAENRLNRELETREKTTRKKSWNRPEVLPSPTPEEGYAFRWIRVAMQGTVDATNVSSKLREGWEPVKATDHPEITLVAERTEHFEGQTRTQMDSVDNNLMRENDARMPLFNERKTKVTFGKGT